MTETKCNQTEDLVTRCALAPHALYRLCEGPDGTRFWGNSDLMVAEELAETPPAGSFAGTL